MSERPDLPWADPRWAHLPGEGWWPIIASLDQDLRLLCPDYTVVQVKEKFGGLRFYANGLDPQGHEIVLQAERAASITCEMCGRAGTLRSERAWVKTRCEKHKDD